MARNQVTRGQRPGAAPDPPPRSLPIVPILLLAGAALGIGLPFVARASTPRRVLPPHAPLQLAVAPSPVVEVEQPVADPASNAPRSFMDDTSAGSAAYASGDFESALGKYQDAIARNP